MQSARKLEDISCWVVCEDGLTGTLNQCLGVAEALQLPYENKAIKLNQPWKSLSPYLGFETQKSFTPSLNGPWPDLVIAAGRKSISASRYIKHQSHGKSFTVQLQDPRICASNFDLVAVPEHDHLRADNVLVTAATPNRITKTKLEQAKKDFATFIDLPAPRIAVLIGGDSRAYKLTRDIMLKLSLQLSHLKDHTLMITASRRTGEENVQILKDHINLDKHFLWDGHGPNPYFGMLAWADVILVSADSASMLSEACSTGKPVYMIKMKSKGDKATRRIDKLHQKLQQSGALRIFDGHIEHWDYTPLNDAQIVAQEIKKRMELI